MATIADVASHAGVSMSTVSYVLSGKRPISEETRRRVQELPPDEDHFHAQADISETFRCFHQLGRSAERHARCCSWRLPGILGLFQDTTVRV